MTNQQNKDNLDFNVIDFKFGKQKRSLKEWIQFGAIFHLILNTVSLIPGLKKEKVFNFVDIVQKRLNLESINDYIIQDPELLTYRIRRIISEAIEEHNRNTKQ